MTLPARKEGIIPGAANLRLSRFIGAACARQAIMMGRRLDCDSPEGRMICDVIVPPDEMEAAIDGWSTISPTRAWLARPAIGALFASAKNHSTLSAATWRSMPRAGLLPFLARH